MIDWRFDCSSSGHGNQWEEVKGLMKSIENYKTEFDNLDQSININERLANFVRFTQ